jgi:hypothetical protein
MGSTTTDGGGDGVVEVVIVGTLESASTTGGDTAACPLRLVVNFRKNCGALLQFARRCRFVAAAVRHNDPRWISIAAALS